MIHSPGFPTTVIAFLCVIGPLVFVHEMGHYWVARWCGVKVEAFSIGMGREITGWTDKRGTRWKVAWLPIGGYVRFAGDMNAASQPSAEWLALPAAERNRTFQAKAVWQRALIVAAGPITNFLAAILILAGFAMAFGDVRIPPVAGTVVPGSAAARAGLRPGDRLTAVDGAAVTRFEDIGRAVLLRAGERVRIDFARDGRTLSTAAVIGSVIEQDRFGNKEQIGRLGIGGTRAEIIPVGLAQAPLVAVRQVRAAISLTVSALGRVITGRTAVNILHGPVGMAKVAGEQFTLGWSAFAFLLALVSINLGFINLLPVPMLDGGHLLFLALEAVRRRPVDAAVQEWAYRGGLAALLALMLLVTINDLGSLGLW